MADMAASSALAPAPVSASERLYGVDVLRGFALLGILLMNIASFGLPEAAYFNPRVAGGYTGANLWAWIAQYVLFDGRMRGIFSLVFGAGAYIFITRAEQRGAPAADLFLRRSLWLFLFGLLHAYLIWLGDILYYYATCALLFLYAFRKLSVRALLIIAGAQFLLMTGAQVGNGFRLRDLRDRAAQADQAAARGEKLSLEQRDAQKEWKDELGKMFPDAEAVQKEIADYRGGWVSAAKRRAGTVMRWHSMPPYLPMWWDMLAMMLIGIALIKARVLAGEGSWRLYGWTAALGLAIGLPINAYAAWKSVAANFEPLLLTFTTATYQLGRVAVTLAYVAILLMVVKAGMLRWLTSRLAAVGQMAFTNYLTHSIVCTLLFNGYGFGLFGKLERHQLYYVVPVIWIFQLVVSPIWLRYFRFGPVEWGWRSLTYWQRQPMRVRRELPAAEAVAAVG
jgi:uncharacterized protein